MKADDALSLCFALPIVHDTICAGATIILWHCAVYHIQVGLLFEGGSTGVTVN